MINADILLPIVDGWDRVARGDRVSDNRSTSRCTCLRATLTEAMMSIAGFSVSLLLEVTDSLCRDHILITPLMRRA